MSRFIPIEFQKSFDKTQQNAFVLQATYTKDECCFGSQFGGYPFWQKGFDIPMDEEGFPMALLVQINFAEVPPHPDLPQSGILQFFIPKQDDYYGANLENKGSGQLISKFWKDPDFSKQQEWPKTLSEDDLVPVNGKHSLLFTEKKEVAGIDTIECAEALQKNPFEALEDVSLNEKEATQFFDNIAHFADAKGHKLLGYPYFLDLEPRKSSDYRLLLQIDTDMEDDNDIMWGDNGVGYLFIRNEDLKNHRFDNVWFYWDCAT